MKPFGDLYFGSMRDYNYFTGYLKEVAIFDRVLSAAEIESIYLEGLQLKSPVVRRRLGPQKVSESRACCVFDQPLEPSRVT